eukprot:scaffold69502_cov67-Phaeocystis_antarctica.AAC.7
MGWCLVGDDLVPVLSKPRARRVVQLHRHLVILLGVAKQHRRARRARGGGGGVRRSQQPAADARDAGEWLGVGAPGQQCEGGARAATAEHDA